MITNAIVVHLDSLVAVRIVADRVISVVPGGSSTSVAGVLAEWQAGGWNLTADGDATIDDEANTLTIPVRIA